MIKIESEDKKVLQISVGAASQSKVLSNYISSFGIPENTIPIQNVVAPVLSKIIVWCEQHRNDPVPVGSNLNTIVISEWDQKFLDNLGLSFQQLLHGTNSLEVDGLTSIICQSIANFSLGKTSEEIRNAYGIPTNQEYEIAEKALKAASSQSVSTVNGP